MKADDLLLLRGNEVIQLLRGREKLVVDAVRSAYLLKEEGDVSMPNCAYLRFAEAPANRIIPKPAYLGGRFRTAGLKWIASFPGNLQRGLERATATIILNSAETGEPLAVLEGSVISACRTAASAALAATELAPEPPSSIGIIGCGLINFETLRFLVCLHPQVTSIRLFDVSRERAEAFAERARAFGGERDVQIVTDTHAALHGVQVTSIATNVSEPHLADLRGARPESVILHISLRDFAPAAILSADNVVDDVEHVCTNGTSLELAQRSSGSAGFIRTTLGAILRRAAPPRDGSKPVIFSPFGLGVLDLAVASLVVDLATGQGAGTVLHGFAPDHWLSRRD